MSIQRLIDNFWQTALLRFLPHWVKPNFFTAWRFILIPVILYFIAARHFWLVLALFLVAAICDSVDGSLARQRHLTSSLGRILDPLADKFLIVFISLFLAYLYPYPVLILTTAIFDLLLIVATVIFFLFVFQRQKVPPANWWGKLKMIFQVLGLLVAIIFLASGGIWLLIISAILFFLVIIFEFISFLSYGTGGIF